jgi:hypothetical protein
MGSMRLLLVAWWFVLQGTAYAAQGLDCRAVLDVPEEAVRREYGSLGGEVSGLVGRLLQAGGNATLLRETKEILQKYPLDSRSRHCSIMSYLACGILGKEDDTSLAERVNYMQLILDSCNKVALEALTAEQQLGPLRSDPRFEIGPIVCRNADGQLSCGMTIESVNRDRLVYLRARNVELVDDLGNVYVAKRFRMGSSSFANERYEFKANTATKLETLFENIDRSVTGGQNLSMRFSNLTDKDELAIVYRNLTFE